MTSHVADISIRSANRASIIAAATRLFARNGYAASMEHIAAEARVAKQTVYNHFANKEALLTAIVDTLVDQLGEALPEPDAGIDDPRATLLDYAHRLVAILVQPETLGLHRVLIAGAPHHPELARIAYQAGVVQSTQRLARYLRGQARRGALSVPDPELAAEQLLGALRGNIQLRALLLRDGVQDQESLQRYAGAVIDAFLRAHRPA